MKNLSVIHPENISDNQSKWFSGFLRSLLIRTNFTINVRNRLGWRGLKPTYRNGEGWTCRIKNSKGIYGICFNNSLDEEKWKTGSFKLYYFPSKDEELVNSFSIEATLACQQPDYIELVRDFLVYPDFSELYEIGEINLSVSSDNQALTCSLVAQEYKQSISISGLCCEISGEINTIFEPGDMDQNLPAYDLARIFFDILAATLSFNLSESPAFLKQITHQNNKSEINKSDEDYLELALGYNQEWFKKYPEQIVNNGSNINKEIFWKAGIDIPQDFIDAAFWDAHLHKSARFEKSYFDIEERPQFILLTGFLGSGKTSFLKHFIEYHTANNRFVAVIQNEIGETGLDAKLLEDNYAVLEMDEGCVCCSLIGQLKKGIKQILSNHKPDVIILETSGLANPLNLLDELDEIRELIRFDSVTTIVDGQNYASAMQFSEIVIDQITCADILLLNKTDLLSKQITNSISEELQLLNPNAQIIESIGGDINPALLYNIDENQVYKSNKFNKNNTKSSHTSNHNSEGISSKKLTFNQPLQKEIFLKKINDIPLTVYRIKGVLRFTDNPEPYFFQSVNGQIELTSANNGENHENFLIFIGEKTSLNRLNIIYFTN